MDGAYGDPDAEMKIKDFLLNPSEDTAFTVPLLRQWLSN